MKNLAKIFFTFIIALNITFLSSQLHSETSDDEYYTIKRGDTLWDISQKFWDDPFQWPQLWELNPFITNPHLIYPDESLNLTLRIKKPVSPQVTAAVETAEEPITEEAEIQLPKPPTLVFSRREAKSIFITQEMSEEAGMILDSKEGQVIMGERDMVYLKMSPGGTAHVGQKFTISNNHGEVIHPKTGESMGHMIDILGTLEITRTGDKLYEAKIIYSNKEILKGANILNYLEPTQAVVLKKAAPHINGIILFSWEDKELIASRDIVMIDKGHSDGLEAGNVLYVFREGREIHDPGSEIPLQTPMRKLGTLVVIETQKHTSTAMVTMSKRVIYKGDLVKSCSDCYIETAEN
jgi:hypothetical protein